MGSSPNLFTGQVPSAQQWNAYFAAKQDDLGYTPLNRAGDSMLPGSNLTAAASTSLGAGLSILAGSAPDEPQDGDVWVTAAGIFVQINGQTVGPLLDAATPAISPLVAVSANYTVQSTDRIVEVSAAASNRIVTIAPGLGASSQAPIFRIVKTDITTNVVAISDGIEVVDFISAPATATGQINGWRDVYSNGTTLRSMGVG